MDDSPKFAAKKLRQRHQRDRKKQPGSPSAPINSVGTVSNGSDPRPQRTNRRQRDEVPTTAMKFPASASNAASPSLPDNADVKVTSEKENVDIDFSNLKRETEEITKLTKKFAKRSISSNWHRYSAPEVAEDNGKEEEEDAPADFSALIQVPASKGGHLQLKDEKEWSSAANEKLGGYFTLNLKLLNQSLACVPLYEQLQLPRHMLTEEEIKHFDTLASGARKHYNPEKFGDSNEKSEDTNESDQKTLMSLLQKESDDAAEVSESSRPTKDVNTNNDLSNLDFQENNVKTFDFDSKAEIIPINSSGNNNLNTLKTGPPSPESDDLPLEVVNKENKLVKQPNLDLYNRVLEETCFLSSPTNNEISKTETYEVSKKIDQSSETKPSIKAENKISNNTTKEIPCIKTNNSKSTNDNNPKDKHIKYTSETCTKNVSENKLNKAEGYLKLEDDDDLDFLLSLKNPAIPGTKKINPVTKKDSSSKPSSAMASTETEELSELDNWLDSVLQD